MTETTNPQPDETRFWSKVIKTDNCWPWNDATSRGYGRYCVQGRRVAAHRFAYELRFGPIPNGLKVDHTCHNEDPTCAGGETCAHRRCVNPDHLEAVTDRENTLRGRGLAAACAKLTHCPQGHPYDDENTYRPRSGERRCRACRRAYHCRRRAKARALAAVSQPGKEAFTPPVHYERDDGVECCVHAIPVGPDSCPHCRELADEEPTP